MTETKTATRERGIIMTGESVRAILGGRKTQTRRTLKNQGQALTIGMEMESDAVRRSVIAQCPYGVVGDRLWVRETWALVPFIPREAKQIIRYAAGDSGYGPEPERWRSPIHMPREFARITLAITDVRVQRVQDISGTDAIAEGLQQSDRTRGWLPGNCAHPEWAFAIRWEEINGRRAPWAANPWVWVLTFRRL